MCVWGGGGGRRGRSPTFNILLKFKLRLICSMVTAWRGGGVECSFQNKLQISNYIQIGILRLIIVECDSLWHMYEISVCLRYGCCIHIRRMSVVRS